MDQYSKYIIWGAGFRGEKLLSFLSKERVVAFIDNDINKVGTEVNGVPVIDYSTYSNCYQKFFIVISILDYREVELFLIKKSIYQYFILGECPSEFSGYGVGVLDYLLDFTANKLVNNVIVGSNLYSCLLYEKMRSDGAIALYCYPNENRSLRTIQKMKELLNMNVVINLEQEIQGEGDAYITTRREKGIEVIHKLGLNCINAQDFSYRIKKYYNPLLKEFQNKHLGKRCFIVATGPSLSIKDIRVLAEKKEICFSMNRIFLLEQCDNWLPDYYVAADTKFLKEHIRDILCFPAKTKFIGDFVSDEVYDDTMYSIHCVTDDVFSEPPIFSEDITHTIYCGATITYVCLQIAVYMGFKEIYLLGVDCNYNRGSKNNYFFQEEKEDYKNHETDRMILTYQSAKQYADLHGIKIYNATRGGKLEVFERVDFDELFA